MNSFTKKRVLFLLITINAILLVTTVITHNIFVGLIFLFTKIILGIAIYDVFQTKHALLRNYPLIGRFRWMFEDERSKIQQYFIEDDTNGTPYNREKSSDVYQKAKKEINSTPFGTNLNVYEENYECIAHSMYPKDVSQVIEPRVLIGGKKCVNPYSASVFNISAMSYGALSDAAIRALNGGAKMGGFYHNTGEGGVSPYHIENGGDLCYQIGTGYFGCGKTLNGKRYFDEEQFIKTISNPSIKMIEIKLSQGAKPGHGGILPASKNTKEIANIRGIEPNIDVLSPPYHTAFNDSTSLLKFVDYLRETTNNNLPIGIKLCVGSKEEFIEFVNTMKELKSCPDFITIDGGEGGTGAAPLVFTNYVGLPLIDALKIVNDALVEADLRQEIVIIASGKATTAFDIIKLIAMGADIVNAARAFMLSLGCIRAKECNRNTCPVGIATQNRELINGLDVSDKKLRVFNYHNGVIHELKELLAAMGLSSIKQITKNHLLRRVNGNMINLTSIK